MRRKGIAEMVFMMVLTCLLAGCGAEEQTGDRPLARVQNRYLYLSEMEGMFPPNATAEDSNLIIQAFVNRWTRDAVLLQEAERNVPADLNIDRLVRDYRASLIRSNYEKVVVEELMDSTVTKAELEAFYKENQGQYQLESTIVRCYFIKVPTPTPEADRLRQLWNNGDVNNLPALRDYCERYAVVSLLRDSAWYSIDEIASMFPRGTLTANNVGSKREFTQQDGHHQYFFRLLEQRDRREIAPLSYVEEQARKVILHRRKLQVLEEFRESMYERELRRKNVEFLW